MKIALFHDYFDPTHLGQVKAEMLHLGTPTIRAVWIESWDMWVALEGCHRLRAAAELGIVPEIEEIPYSEGITTVELGYDFDFQGDEWTIDAIVEDACKRTVLDFEDGDR